MSHALAPVGERGGWRGDDFPAWLSPMLVKELRQGIQSGAFAWTFVGLQIAMFLIMSWVVTLVADRSGPAARGFDGLVWAAIGFAMVLLVPLRGLGAIAAERAGSNLDLVRLTHLSATRIVVGKWFALVSQALLLATAVLPYLVLRHFFGGIDVLRDLETFAWLAAAAMLVAAAAVAMSTLPLWLRIGSCVGGAVFGLPAAVAVLEDSILFAGFRRMADPALARLGVGILIALYTVACLEFAAGRIAPAAENHAARRRLLALALAAAWVAVAAVGTREAALATLLSTAPLLVGTCVGALVEPPTRLATVVAPFARAGRAGRVAARVLAPGWATGLVFVAIAWCLFVAGWLVFIPRHPPREGGGELMATVVSWQIVATLVFPVPLVVHLPRARLPLLLYALPQLVCFMIFVWAGAAWSVGRPWHESAAWIAVLPFPLAALLSYASMGEPALHAAFGPPFLAAAGAVLVVALGAVARPWGREMRALGGMLVATHAGRTG